MSVAIASETIDPVLGMGALLWSGGMMPCCPRAENPRFHLILGAALVPVSKRSYARQQVKMPRRSIVTDWESAMKHWLLVTTFAIAIVPSGFAQAAGKLA